MAKMHEVIAGARVEGRVELDGESIYDDGVDPVNVRRTIGMVFQRPNPYPTMSIYDNVAAGLKLTGRHSKTELDGVVEKALRDANLHSAALSLVMALRPDDTPRLAPF